MSDVAIIGAGDLGGALASSLAAGDRFRRITLVDDQDGVARGKALDVQQSGPIEPFAARVDGDGRIDAAAGADVIVVADQVGPPVREWHGEPALALVAKLRTHNPRAPIVLAGAQQAWVIERSVRELGVSPGQLVGSAPEALVAALRALCALELGASALDVSLTVVGCPPERVLVPWGAATLAGQPIGPLMDAAARSRMERRLSGLWPPGPYALASAARRVCEAIVTSSRRSWTCFAYEAAGRHEPGTVISRPVTLARAGIGDARPIQLDGPEQLALERVLAC